MADDLFTAAELLAANGTERLRLIYVREDGGANFHSLSFDVRAADVWSTRNVITRENFQGEHPSRRWISDLHTFNPIDGVAVIRVGEGTKPTNAVGATSFVYSWRSWDVLRNVEIAHIKDCDSPFDPL